MKTLLLFLISAAPLMDGLCQSRLAGKITDKNGQPLPWANVSISGTYEGASADEEGRFEFTTNETGHKALVVTFTGFETFRKEITLNGSPLYFDIKLYEHVNALDVVTITAGSFTAGDQSGRTMFRAVDIATVAGATADIAGALNTLPGTQKVGESGRLFVRGGDGNETRTFIDGLMVLDAYSPAAPNTPSRGRFLPFMFKGTSFSTGGYSAEYGQALSSALILESKDKAELTRTDLGLLSVGGDIGHTRTWEKGSVAGKLSYTNIRPYFSVIDQNIDWETPPVSIEGHTAFRLQSGKHGLLKVYGNFNRTHFSLYDHGMDNLADKQPYDLTQYYKYLNGSYNNTLNENWVVRGGLSYTHLRDNSLTNLIHLIKEERGIHAKTVFEGSISDNLELKTGAEVIHKMYYQDTAKHNSLHFNEMVIATFSEADVYISNRFVSRAGLRIEYNTLNRRSGIDPRFSLAYRTGSKGQVSLAYGQFRQSPANELLAINTGLRPEKAAHYILNYQRIDNNRTFRVEGYYKRYSQLVKYHNVYAHQANNEGYGFAQGFELFWRDHQSAKNTDYWISYSFLNTQRDYLDFSVEATPAFASKHNISIVLKHFFTNLKSQLGLAYAYTSGRPHYNPNLKGFVNAEIPSYQDLSLNWSYLPTSSLIIYVSCTNLLGRDNIFGYEYSTERNVDGIFPSRPIRPPAKNFVFVGVFITLSKEKSVNQLPNL